MNNIKNLIEFMLWNTYGNMDQTRVEEYEANIQEFNNRKYRSFKRSHATDLIHQAWIKTYPASKYINTLIR